MIPLLPTFALALVSFVSSAFVILRVIIPALPPSRFSRRAAPSEFGLPNTHTHSPADKSHLWLAGCDLLALVLFVWQALQESLGGPSDFAEASDPGSAVRLWLVMTVRQTCLLIVASIALLHVRMGRSVSLGSKHWMLWAPTLLLAISSTAIAGVLAGTGAKTLFSGIIGYSIAVAIITSVAFGWLIVTLVMIKRNLAALNESADSWPPVTQVENKSHPPFAKEMNAMRDGSSWITSDAGSHHESISNWSFSSHKHQASYHVSPRANPANASHRFMPSSVTPCNDKCKSCQHPRVRSDSQGSWLTSPSTSQETLSQWSYSTTRPNASAPDLRADMLPSAPRLRPSSPPLANAQVLDSHNAGHAPGNTDTEKGLASLAVTNDSVIDVSLYRAIGWLIIIWVPLGLALPYFFLVSPSGSATPLAARVLLVMSVTISSPLLALNLLLRSPMPIPVGLFDTRKGSNATTPASRFKHGSLDNYAREYKRSGSITVVEGRRSGDIWLSNGDAVVNKNKFGRTMEMLTPAPKLSILPPEESSEDRKYTSPLPRIDNASCLDAPAPAPQVHNRAELRRTKSLDLSHYSASNESLACTTKIMIARKHFSTPAQTIMVPASEHQPGILDPPGAAIDKPSNGNLRTRSIPSAMRLSSTGFTVKNGRLAKMGHRKSLSSDVLPLKVIDDINEIDAMTAGLLPRLVPGLKVGRRMKIRDNIVSADMFNVAIEKELSPELRVIGAFEAFSSPELHSTPARKEEARSGKIPEHNGNHHSSLSLSLGKDGDHFLAMRKADTNCAFENQVGEGAIVSDDGLVQRAVAGGDAEPPRDIASQLRGVDERADIPPIQSESHFGHTTRPLGRCISASSSRESVATLSLNAIPPSAASTMTLFEFEAGLGPQAESTPFEDQKKKHPTSRKAPPRSRLPTPHVRRSSIIHTKADDDLSANPATSSRSFSRAVRQLVPKRNILQRTASSDSKPGSPSGILRPLSLLQDRDTNRQMTSPSGARPLSPGKREQWKIHNDENDAPPLVASPRGWSFRQLQLARSEMSKQQDVPQAFERLSDADIDSMSMAEQVYGYAL